MLKETLMPVKSDPFIIISSNTGLTCRKSLGKLWNYYYYIYVNCITKITRKSLRTFANINDKFLIHRQASPN